MQISNPIIEISNVSKVYKVYKNSVTALKNINLKLYDNEFCALFGPSGSGKSTLLNLIGLIDKPTTGSILLEGLDVTKLDHKKLSNLRLKQIGFIFQKYYLLDELNCIENTAIPALAKEGFSKDVVSKAKHLLELVGLKDRLRHKPKHLSEGEKQRVAIARSLINEPRILLCDEPTASLDADNGNAVLDLLTKINAEKGVMVFLVTHDEMHLKYAKRIIYIRNALISNDTQRT
jgi:putative ABC transport system ATP-binding protein